ncbi:MAG: NUDIX domain-containing protein [Pseudomonadota bacterium]
MTSSSTLRASDYIRPESETLLSDDWARLTKYTFEYRRADGAWQRLVRQSYDRGNGAGCLLYNPAAGTVLLVRQFRLPAYLLGEPGFLIEVPAGLLDGEAPEARMIEELSEETGYEISGLELACEAFMSPGSVTEKLSLFLGTYSEANKKAAGGGKIEEGEDIEVLHIALDQAMEMISSGDIQDGKTILLLQHLKLKLLQDR